MATVLLLNFDSDISVVHEQIERYYESVKPIAALMAEEGEMLLKQKLELGLFKQSQARLEAMKTLFFSRDISNFQFIIFLIDYNPYSKKLDLTSLKSLPFADQIRVFTVGFALWQKNMKAFYI